MKRIWAWFELGGFVLSKGTTIDGPVRKLSTSLEIGRREEEEVPKTGSGQEIDLTYTSLRDWNTSCWSGTVKLVDTWDKHFDTEFGVREKSCL